MKIAYVTPGHGLQFYCQNCFRDTALLQSLSSLGHKVIKVPMYLPSGMETPADVAVTPVFYGAVNIYLKEKLPFYRSAPVWIERLLDSPSLLHLAAKKSGSTRPTGLEEMTLSMLEGEKGRQASELDHLIQHLRDNVGPDVVHLSNALLLGLAHRLKADLGAGVVCSLQDENEWVDLMGIDYQKKVWKLMAEKAVDVDFFVSASQYYADKTQEQLKLPGDRIKVIHGGIDLEGYEKSTLPFDPPVIGYLCRLSEYFGLDILVDAFMALKEDNRFRDLKLHLTGGYSGDDKPFLNGQMKKIAEHGFKDDVILFDDFCKSSRVAFLKSLTLLSVPVPTGEAFGAYQVEALAAGVPVVQPNVGCYPEFVEKTQGGLIYEPNTGEKLASAMASLLSDPDKIRKLGDQGRRVVLENFSMDHMAKNIAGVYEDVT
ncbi:MAG: glycosyltransferase family 4 protein [Candidatus Aminicenantes bacterium]|nr:MAG: glycosyltransferase family 4 protein [Candidatus Aminicenantes bacterium]